MRTSRALAAAALAGSSTTLSSRPTVLVRSYDITGIDVSLQSDVQIVFVIWHASDSGPSGGIAALTCSSSRVIQRIVHHSASCSSDQNPQQPEGYQHGCIASPPPRDRRAGAAAPPPIFLTTRHRRAGAAARPEFPRRAVMRWRITPSPFAKPQRGRRMRDLRL